jgi:hypothetical protein
LGVADGNAAETKEATLLRRFCNVVGNLYQPGLVRGGIGRRFQVYDAGCRPQSVNGPLL